MRGEQIAESLASLGARERVIGVSNHTHREVRAALFEQSHIACVSPSHEVETGIALAEHEQHIHAALHSCDRGPRRHSSASLRTPSRFHSAVTAPFVTSRSRR